MNSRTDTGRQAKASGEVKLTRKQEMVRDVFLDEPTKAISETELRDALWISEYQSLPTKTISCLVEKGVLEQGYKTTWSAITSGKLSGEHRPIYERAWRLGRMAYLL